jgi:predicted transcriptional regulator
MRRNDLDICVDILHVARKGAKKTHIVYKANLNFKIVKKYINRLIKTGMLSSANDSSLYVTTGQGIKFLIKYNELVTPMKPV